MDLGLVNRKYKEWVDIVVKKIRQVDYKRVK